MDRNSLKIVGDAYDTLKNIAKFYARSREIGFNPGFAANQRSGLKKQEAIATIMEHLPEMILELDEAAPRKNLDIWKTGDGRRLHVTEIDNQHLVNIIRFLREVKWTKRKDQLPIMIEEAQRRGLKYAY